MPAQAAVFFSEFKRKNIDGSILNSFNKLIDLIKWNNESDITNVAEKIGATEPIVKIYEEHMDAYSSKCLSMKNNIAYRIVSREQFFELYHTLSNDEKKFIQFIFASPKLLFEHYSSKYSQGIVDYGFDMYLNDQMNALDEDVLYGPYSIIDCIVNPTISSAIMTDISCDITNADLFWAHLEMLINYGKTTGNKQIVNFSHALNITQRLASNWNQLITSSHTMNEEAAAAARVMKEADEDIDRIVNVYRGIYTDVPDDYPAAHDIVTGLVSNFINFNKLSRTRKLQVSNYLLNNRERFNRTLSQAVKIVADSIAHDCDRCESIDFEKYGVKEIKDIGYRTNNNNMARDTAMKVKESFSKVRGKQSVQKMNYIVNCFIPLMNKFKSEVMNKYGNESQRLFSNLNNNFQMFGGDIFEDDSPVIPLETPEPVVKYVRDNSFDDIYAEAIFGGDPVIEVRKGPEVTPEQMIKEIVDAQVNFNREYETCYRELIKAIEAVHFDNIYANSVNKLYPMCRVFNDIAIKKTKTTIYLSGLYGKKNRNNAYREVVHQTIQTLQDSKMNQFADCIRVLQKLEQLLINSANKAKDIRNRFVKSPRISSALLIVAATQVKVPCKLTNADFTAFDEAVNRLYYQLRNASSESNILNSKDEIKKYLDKVSNREAIIKEDYELKDQKLQWEVQQIEDVTLRNVKLQISRTLNKTLLDSVLYINNVVETYLTKQKMEDLHAKALSHDEIKHIESAMLLFRRAKLSTRYHEEFKKLQKMLDENKSVFEVVNQVARIFSASRYIDFIAMIYKELNIFDNNFNWEEFNRRMLQFMVLNSIEVANLYRLPRVSFNNLLNNHPEIMLQTKEKFFAEVASLISRYILHLPTEFNNVYKAFYHAKTTNIKDELNKCQYLKDEKTIAAMSSGTNFETVATAAGYKDFADMISDSSKPNEKYFHNVNYTDKTIPIFNNGMGVAFKYEQINKNNDTIIDAVFDSLILGVTNIVDKYWQLKYKGSLPLPMNVNMMLKGGSVFDTEEFHDISTSNVIPEAVPFYVTALNVCQYYIQELVHKTDTEGIQQELKISPISVLYPIYEIFDKYKARIETFSIPQLTTCIGVLNELWNQTTGSNEIKLSASIDLLLNELNASIFLTSDLENSIIESGFGSVASFNRLAYTDLEKVSATINKIYKSAAMNSYVGYSPEEQQIGFEKLMSKCYQRIKNIPEPQRMTELRSMLNAEDDSNIPMHEYYKFMDLVIAPIVVCYTSYNNVFKLFDVYASKSKSVDVKMDLKLVTLTVNDKTYNFWEYMNKPNLTTKDIEDNITYSSAVQRWNTIQYGKIFEEFAKTGKLVAPNFWFPSDRNTWPTTSTCEYHLKEIQGYTTILPQLRSLFGEVNAKTVGDYFEFAVREFASDLDQALHVFMSYPGMTDQVIRQIEDTLHDRLDAAKMMSDVPEFKTRLEIFRTIKIEKSTTYTKPYWKEISIPAFFEDRENMIPSINMVQIDKSDGKGHSTFDGIPFGFNNGVSTPKGEELSQKISTFSTGAFYAYYGPNGSKCRNGWTDYIIYRLAKCHPQYQIPYKLVQMLQSDPMIGKYCQGLYANKDKVVHYNFQPIGNNFYNNYVTQNIISRSSVESNKAISDYSTFGQVVINSMVAILPYLISKVQNIYETTSSEVEVDKVTHLRVLDECGSLISILSKFYNEISLSVTPMSFLQEGLSAYSRDHCIGELKNYIDRSIDDITDFTGIEWANKYKFTNLTSITYPDFKNKDKFEWIHKFAENVFTHPIFRQNFNVIKQNMGKQAWNSIISKSLKIEAYAGKRINENLFQQVNWLLNIFIQSGSTKKDNLQWLFDIKHNDQKMDNFKTAINDAGFRVTGGKVDDEFKDFAWTYLNWNSATKTIKINSMSYTIDADGTKNVPGLDITTRPYQKNVKGYIVYYKHKSGNSDYLYAFDSEAKAKAALTLNGKDAPKNSDYENGVLLGYGILSTIGDTDPKKHGEKFKVERLEIRSYKYDDSAIVVTPVAQYDRNQYVIVKAIEKGIDLTNQLKDKNGNLLSDAFTKTAFNISTGVNSVKDIDSNFNSNVDVNKITNFNINTKIVKIIKNNKIKDDANKIFGGNILHILDIIIQKYDISHSNSTINHYLRTIIAELIGSDLVSNTNIAVKGSNYSLTIDSSHQKIIGETEKNIDITTLSLCHFKDSKTATEWKQLYEAFIKNNTVKKPYLGSEDSNVKILDEASKEYYEFVTKAKAINNVDDLQKEDLKISVGGTDFTTFKNSFKDAIINLGIYSIEEKSKILNDITKIVDFKNNDGIIADDGNTAKNWKDTITAMKKGSVKDDGDIIDKDKINDINNAKAELNKYIQENINEYYKDKQVLKKFANSFKHLFKAITNKDDIGNTLDIDAWNADNIQVEANKLSSTIICDDTLKGDLKTDTASDLVAGLNKLFDAVRNELLKQAQTKFDKVKDSIKMSTEFAQNVELCNKLEPLRDQIVVQAKTLLEYFQTREQYEAIKSTDFKNIISVIPDLLKITININLRKEAINQALKTLVEAFMKYENDMVYDKQGLRDKVVTKSKTISVTGTTKDYTIDDLINMTWMLKNDDIEITGFDEKNKLHLAMYVLLKNRFNLQYSMTHEYYQYFRKAIRTFEALFFILCKTDDKDLTCMKENHIFYNYGKTGGHIPNAASTYPGSVLSCLFVKNDCSNYENYNGDELGASVYALIANPTIKKDIKCPKEFLDTPFDQAKSEERVRVFNEKGSGFISANVKNIAADENVSTEKISGIAFDQTEILYYFSMINLFEYIMQKNINKFIDVSVNDVRNYGFLMPPQMRGGMDLVDIFDNPEGKDALNRMKKLYDNQYVPYRMFNSLFNAGMAFRCNSTPDIVHAAMVYFHKFNIGMSSIFNSLCFAQLIINKNILANVIDRLALLAEELPLKDSTNKTTYEMVKTFLKSYVERNTDGIDIAWNNKNSLQAVIGKDKKIMKNREIVFNQESFVTELNASTEKFDYLSNIYKAPSINNNFMTSFISNCFTSDKELSLLQLPFTVAFGHLRRLDMQCTYINMLISLLKLTSFYDADYETDLSYFGDQNNEPFNAI